MATLSTLAADATMVAIQVAETVAVDSVFLTASVHVTLLATAEDAAVQL